MAWEKVETPKDFSKMEKYLRNAVKRREAGFMLFAEYAKSGKLEKIEVYVALSPKFLIESRELLEMIERDELEHPWKIVAYEVSSAVGTALCRALKKLGFEDCEVWWDENGADIYEYDVAREEDVLVASVDVSEVFEADNCRVYAVKCGGFSIRPEVDGYEALANLAKVEKLMKEYLEERKKPTG